MRNNTGDPGEMPCLVPEYPAGSFGQCMCCWGSPSARSAGVWFDGSKKKKGKVDKVAKKMSARFMLVLFLGGPHVKYFVSFFDLGIFTIVKK